MRPAPPEIEALVQRLYDANQRRDFEAFRALVAPDLEWPDATRGGLLTSPEAVRDYWAYNDASIRVEITPVEIHLDDDGRIVVDANQWSGTARANSGRTCACGIVTRSATAFSGAWMSVPGRTRTETDDERAAGRAGRGL